MAKRKGTRIARGQYRYTPKRAMALKRAQAISARKRKGRIVKGVIAGATLAGIGGVAIHGYKNRSRIRDSGYASVAAGDVHSTAIRWKKAVQPGSKERVRLANALSGNIVKKPTGKRPATKGAKSMTRTQIAAVHPNVVDPNRNNAFPKQQKDVEVANSLIEGSDRPYNIDKFLPRGIKGLVHGKRITGAAAARAVKTHVDAKGNITGEDVDGSGILHDMMAEGNVSRVVYGRKTKKKAKFNNDTLLKPKNTRAGATRKPKPKPTLESKAFEQWIEDFE